MCTYFLHCSLLIPFCFCGNWHRKLRLTKCQKWNNNFWKWKYFHFFETFLSIFSGFHNIFLYLFNIFRKLCAFYYYFEIFFYIVESIDRFNIFLTINYEVYIFIKFSTFLRPLVIVFHVTWDIFFNIVKKWRVSLVVLRKIDNFFNISAHFQCLFYILKGLSKFFYYFQCFFYIRRGFWHRLGFLINVTLSHHH